VGNTETDATPGMGAADESGLANYDVMFVYGDIHIPDQHDDLGAILLRIIEDVKPTIILDGGDIICADCLSTYPKAHDELVGLQEELDAATRWFAAVQKVSVGARRIILRDNHFWGRLKKKKKGEYWLERLRAVDGDALLKLDQYGWESMDLYSWKDRIMFIHGDDKQGSSDCPVNRSRKMTQMSGKTIVRFHTHVSGVEMHKHAGQEQFAIQMGTFQDPGKASYLRYPNLTNWTHSAGIFYLSKVSDHFLYVPIFFVGGVAIVNGKLYS